MHVVGCYVDVRADGLKITHPNVSLLLLRLEILEKYT